MYTSTYISVYMFIHIYILYIYIYKNTHIHRYPTTAQNESCRSVKMIRPGVTASHQTKASSSVLGLGFWGEFFETYSSPCLLQGFPTKLKLQRRLLPCRATRITETGQSGYDSR